MANIGGARMVSGLVGDIRDQVQQAMSEARKQVSGAVSELIGEIHDGAMSVESALHAEAMSVRAEFSEMVGNAPSVSSTALNNARVRAAAAGLTSKTDEQFKAEEAENKASEEPVATEHSVDENPPQEQQKTEG